MENRRRFSTFQHDKQTTSYLLLNLETKSVNCPDKPAHLTRHRCARHPSLRCREGKLKVWIFPSLRSREGVVERSNDRG